ncbi:MAG: hypothetical protein KGQ41_08285 [Alphaproteobacteria bacterium]|nr:hypothetical protein [Alphaproteobacteria bacterium]
MKKVATFAFGVAALTALGLLEARAFDLNDISASDRAAIAKQAPAYGGAVVEKMSQIYPDVNSTPAPLPERKAQVPFNLTGIEPAAGGDFNQKPADYRLTGGPAFEMAVGRFSTPGAASGPVDEQVGDARPAPFVDQAKGSRTGL